jgi:hypothetical protein
MKHWTVYCHIHRTTGRRYVGLTSQDWKKRWNQHISRSKRSKGGRWHFPNAVRKYGKDAFDHEVLEVCDTLEEANTAEVRWIEHFDSTNPEKGFNLLKGGPQTQYLRSNNPWDDPEYRDRMSSISRARWGDPSYRAKLKLFSRSNQPTKSFGDDNGARTRPDRLARGEENGASKLDRDTVSSIRKEAATGSTKMALSKKYRVSRTVIRAILNGKTWR